MERVQYDNFEQYGQKKSISIGMEESSFMFCTEMSKKICIIENVRVLVPKI